MIHLLEQLSANAWPAAVNQLLDGWVLRYASGVSRRANSVLALSGGEDAFAERLPVVEAFYARRGLPARFHLSPAVAPADLDARLEAWGYRLDCPTWVMTASLERVLARSNAASGFEVSLLETPDDRWLELYEADPSHRPGERDVRRGILTRIGPPTVFALLQVDGVPAAVGQGVAERGWLGLFSMVTHPEYRRQGAATTVIHALAGWAAAQGAGHSYLQVMETSVAALALYRRLGFEPLYQYHYREQSLGLTP